MIRRFSIGNILPLKVQDNYYFCHTQHIPFIRNTPVLYLRDKRANEYFTDFGRFYDKDKLTFTNVIDTRVLDEAFLLSYMWDIREFYNKKLWTSYWG